MEGVVGSSKKQIPGLARARTAGNVEDIAYRYRLGQLGIRD